MLVFRRAIRTLVLKVPPVCWLLEVCSTCDSDSGRWSRRGKGLHKKTCNVEVIFHWSFACYGT